MKLFVRGLASRPYGLYLYFPGLKRGLALDPFVKRSRGSGFEGSERRSGRVTAFLMDETSEQKHGSGYGPDPQVRTGRIKA